MHLSGVAFAGRHRKYAAAAYFRTPVLGVGSPYTYGAIFAAQLMKEFTMASVNDTRFLTKFTGTCCEDILGGKPKCCGVFECLGRLSTVLTCTHASATGPA